jgi:peptidoglycan/LPS O-acetylase OafA/YrhL
MHATAASEPVHQAHSRLRGLDGLRGLAVIAVVVFHLWPAVLPGGFIGVSVFFTLSGFLITRGLLNEIDQTGGVGLRAFWGRRIRRLWPASAACLALIVVVWLAFAWMSRSISLDVYASFLQVANWRFLATGKAYGLADPSPVAHFWSLAIEEQLYLLVPVLVLIARRRTSHLVAAFGMLIVVSVVNTRINAGDAPVVYYSTITRAAELAAGCLLAVLVRTFPMVMVHRAARAALGLAGGLSIAALAVLMTRTSLGTDAYYRGGLTALAVLSVIAIIGAIWSPTLSRVLSIRVLVWFGAVSYGIYLIHWPVLVALEHTSIPVALRPWLTLAITLIVAPLSLRLLEEPIRLRRISLQRFAPFAGALTAVIVLGSAAGLSMHSPTTIDFAGAMKQLDQRGSAPDTTTDPGAGSAARIGTPERPIRTAMFGDSTAVMLAMGLGFDEPAIKATFGGAEIGCSIGRGGQQRGDSVSGNDSTQPAFNWKKECDWTTRWPNTVVFDGGLDAAIILTGNWDIAGRRVPELGNQWRTVGDPVYDDWLRSEMETVVDSLHAAGASHVLWLTLPAKAGTAPNPRVNRFNELVAGVTAQRPWMSQPDYAGYLSSLGPGQDPRADGMHVTMGTTGSVWADWLNAVVVETARSG